MASEPLKPFGRLGDAEWDALLRDALSLPAASEALLRRALDFLPAGTPVSEPEGGVLRRVLAVITFDSCRPGTLALDMRALAHEGREWMFQADGHDIDLRVAPLDATGLRYLVSGQLFGPDVVCRVRLLQVPAADASSPPLATDVDELGEFFFDGLRPGRFVLSLQLGDREIVLPELQIGGWPAGEA